MRFPLVLIAALVTAVAVALYLPATAPAPNEGGGGGGGYPYYCNPANDWHTYGGPTLYIWGPDGGWAWRYCAYGVTMLAHSPTHTVEYGWVDSCYPPYASCWRWRRF